VTGAEITPLVLWAGESIDDINFDDFESNNH
jgi:hypothetical protein